MENELVLKNNLKEARAKKQISQRELAEMVGVSRNTISSIETGQFNPTAKLALIICIALDKKFEELFYFQIRVDFFWKPALFVTVINRSPGDGSATSMTAYNPGMRL